MADSDIQQSMLKRLIAIRVSICLVIATLAGHALWNVVPGVGGAAAIRSAEIFAPLEVRELPHMLFQVASYSLFPADLKIWFDISWAILLMSVVLSWRLSDRLYLLAFVVGAIAGGVSFIISGPEAVLLGPVMAAYGLVGFYCVSAVRNWSSLHWAARLFSVVIFGIGALTVITAFIVPPGTRIAEATATVVAAITGLRVIPKQARNSATETSSAAQAA